MEENYDLIVLGTGSAGIGVASRCRQAGWSVAIVDFRPYGGTCALRGCDPKKVLVGGAETLQRLRRMHGRGLRETGATIDWPALMRFKRSFTAPVPASNEKWLADAGIASYHGRASFVAARAVEVDGAQLVARRIHIATGAKPAGLEIPGAEHLTDSTALLELETLPDKVVLVGGGYVSFEFAHVLAQAGSEVTIVHRGARPLEQFDPDLVGWLVEHSRRMGVRIALDTHVESIASRGDQLEVHARTPEGAASFRGDLVVHGAGRVPEFDGLALERGDVAYDSRGISVDQYLRSVSNEAVSAAGDCAATVGPPLTPVAAYEASVVAHNLLHDRPVPVSYPPVPSIVFTDPPLAAVGLLESEANAQGLRFDVHCEQTGDWYSTRRVAAECSGYKVLISKDSGLILGAHVLGPGAEEQINLFTLAMRSGLTARDVRHTIFAYPTYASDIASMV